MAIPSYAYLKLKVPEPTSVITVETKTQRALDCE
jgi:NADH/NAD ratio-sensing transcriptional regulator Rex